MIRIRVWGVGALGKNVASLLELNGAGGRRRVRLGSERAGVEDDMAWCTWQPWPDVRIDTVCVAVDGAWHLRLHRIRSERLLHAIESGFALGYTPVRSEPDPAAVESRVDLAVLRTEHGCSAIVGLGEEREGTVRPLAVNANLMQPNAAVPVLVCSLERGDRALSCAVFASPACKTSQSDFRRRRRPRGHCSSGSGGRGSRSPERVSSRRALRARPIRVRTAPRPRARRGPACRA